MGSLLQAISQIRKRIDPFSLQFRLTVGITVVSVLGLGSVAAWTSWKMYQMLIVTHKNNLQYIADRFPGEVEIYSEMLPVETGVQRAINNLSAPNLFMWVKRLDGNTIAISQTLNVASNDKTFATLMSLSKMPNIPQVYAINGRYLLLRGSQLRVKGTTLGQLYIAQDITSDKLRLSAVISGLRIANILAIIAITVAIALYIRRALQPLQQISQMAGAISAEDLGQARLHLDNAPSEVKELAQTCNMMLWRLSAAWEQQREFVSNVSHELRTPLTIVHGYLQSMLRRSANLTEPQREALEIAASEAERTIRLLQDLLDLARVESGYMHFHLEPLVINDLIAEVVGMAEKFSNQVITVEARTFPIQARADRHRLKQVLLNLIDNALKYSDPSQPVTLKLDQIGDNVIIQVRDRGCGIPLQHQTRIFERFYRVDEVRARSTGGSGLGLAIVKTLVEGMGGSVTVRSELGVGSIFTVTLPSQLSKS